MYRDLHAYPFCVKWEDHVCIEIFTDFKAIKALWAEN